MRCCTTVHLQGSLPASSSSSSATQPTHCRSNKRCTCPYLHHQFAARVVTASKVSTKSAATSRWLTVQGAITSAHTDTGLSPTRSTGIWSEVALLHSAFGLFLCRPPWVWRRKLRYDHKSRFALPSNYDNGKRFSVINLISDDYYSQNRKQLLFGSLRWCCCWPKC